MPTTPTRTAPTRRKAPPPETDPIAALTAAVRSGFTDMAARLQDVDRKAESALAAVAQATALARGTDHDLDDEADAALVALVAPAAPAPTKPLRAGETAMDTRPRRARATMKALKATVTELLYDRPYTSAELAKALGVSTVDAGNVVQVMIRSGVRIHRLGTSHVEMWWMSDDLSVSYLRANPRSKW